MGAIGDFVGGITGSGVADASKQAAEWAREATVDTIDTANQRLEQQRQGLVPYLHGIPEDMWRVRDAARIPAHMRAFEEDPTGYTYLANNPMFQAAVDASARQLKGTGAAQGRFNSGGMVDQLFQNYLAQGGDIWNDYLRQGEALQTGQINRASVPARMSQQARFLQNQNLANNAALLANTITGGASAVGAGHIGAANALSQGAANLLNLGMLAFGGMPSFGGGGGGSPIGVWDASDNFLGAEQWDFGGP